MSEYYRGYDDGYDDGRNEGLRVGYWRGVDDAKKSVRRYMYA